MDALSHEECEVAPALPFVPTDRVHKHAEHFEVDVVDVAGPRQPGTIATTVIRDQAHVCGLVCACW